jgi:hypothetical protein
MKNSFFVISVAAFLIVYSAYVFIFNFNIDSYSDIIVATTFFFTLFSGFFITRQNDRYSSIADEISNTDGLFSLLYRISSVAPSVQKKVREALKDHYQKMLDSNNWAYHILNPSNTITKIFNAYAEADGDDADKLGKFSDGYGGAFASIQVSRKRMVMLYVERLLPLHWILVCILGTLVVLSFNFIPNHTLFVNVLKVFFGLAVLFVLLLLKQLDELSIFGKDFNRRTANDILRIIDEKDAEELKRK